MLSSTDAVVTNKTLISATDNYHVVSSLGEYTLLVVGRRIVSDGTKYYVQDQQWSLLSELAAAFDDAVYVSYEQAAAHAEMDKLSVVDESLMRVETNERWAEASSLPTRLGGLRDNWQTIQGVDGPVVTYTFFPGTYSFLVSPAVLRTGTVNAAYFGNEAVDATTGEDAGALYGRARHALYTLGQRYVLGNVDVAFVRDMRMASATDTRVVESKPVTKFDDDILGVETSSSPDETVELLFVASFREVKGHEYLLRALAMLAEDETRTYRLRLVGDGDRREAMERLAADLGIADAVTFTDHIEDRDRLLDKYRAADVFVLPSRSEGFPRVLNEAMAVGLPIVATRVGGIPATLSDRETALLVEPENSTALANALRIVVGNDTLRTRIRETSMARATEFFTDTPAEQHLAELESLVADRTRARGQP